MNNIIEVILFNRINSELYKSKEAQDFEYLKIYVQGLKNKNKISEEAYNKAIELMQ